MPLSEKQSESIRLSNRRINIWEGSVRSGKTYASIVRFLLELKEGPAGDVMILGVSRDSIQRNVLVDLSGLLGMSCPTPKSVQMGVFDRIIYFVGANDERAQKRIQGSTLAIAYCDEITNLPEGVFKMLLSRLSIPKAKLFGTTNPDSPFHWLKVDYLDRAEELDLSRWSFRLDDNPSLTKEYLTALRREYTGLWGRRYVDGEWVVASGLIYDMFNESCVINTEPSASKYVVCVDYGTNAPCAFLLLGYNLASYPHYWVEREYYWDSKAHQRQKTDSEYGDDFMEFCQNRVISAVVVDPSSASFKTELEVHHNISNIINGDNDVLPGIRTVSSLFASGDLKVHRRCTNLIRELGSYRWDERGRNAGGDVVLKQNDHASDALRYGIMHIHHPHLDQDGSFAELNRKNIYHY